MNNTKKIILICLLSLVAIVAGCFAYAFISYAIRYTPMNSFITLETSIILSCVCVATALAALALILLVILKKTKRNA